MEVQGFTGYLRIGLLHLADDEQLKLGLKPRGTFEVDERVFDEFRS